MIKYTYPITIAALLLLGLNNVTAAPTGKDLLDACNKSIESGFSGVEGQMCAWYIIPCDCDTDFSLPKICLPENIELDDLAKIIIDGIFQQPELQKKYAALTATTILSQNFPCTG
jgi:hypothetical protein